MRRKMKENGKQYMAIDQYGHTYHGLTHPRKDLCERIGRQHVSKMYIDGKDGKTYHGGYVIGGLWLSVCEVTPMRIPV
jgi:hypothetical protein